MSNLIEGFTYLLDDVTSSAGVYVGQDDRCAYFDPIVNVGYQLDENGHIPFPHSFLNKMPMLKCVDGPDLLQIEHDRYQWSLDTFPRATVKGGLEKAKGEIEEIEDDIAEGVVRVEEYIDVLMCIFDAAQRAGISLTDITQAYAKKLAVNRSREWIDNKNGTYSHVK